MQAASQGKLGEDVEADVSPCFEDKDEESSAIPKMYQLSFFVQGRNVSWVQNAENEKAAMAAGAKIILKKFLPGERGCWAERDRCGTDLCTGFIIAVVPGEMIAVTRRVL